jgi:hypothetical protein
VDLGRRQQLLLSESLCIHRARCTSCEDRRRRHPVLCAAMTTFAPRSSRVARPISLLRPSQTPTPARGSFRVRCTQQGRQAKSDVRGGNSRETRGRALPCWASRLAAGVIRLRVAEGPSLGMAESTNADINLVRALRLGPVLVGSLGSISVGLSGAPTRGSSEHLDLVFIQ